MNKALIYKVLTIAFFGMLWVVPSKAAVDPLACTGYPERRAFVENQSWWTTTPGKTGNDFGHVHAATCMPFFQKLKGTVRFDIRSIMHHNPGKMIAVRVQIMDAAGVKTLVNKAVSRTCSDHTCTFWDTVYVDTTKASYDGRAEFRFHAEVQEPDGKRMRTSSGYQAYLVNGKSYKDYRSTDHFTEGRGWYTDIEYTSARLSSAFPFAPISGSWTFRVDLKPGSGGPPVTFHMATVDPDFHAGGTGLPGTVLKQGSGQYIGYITMDSRKFANGKHRLVLRSDAVTSKGSTQSGLVVIPFTVQN